MESMDDSLDQLYADFPQSSQASGYSSLEDMIGMATSHGSSSSSLNPFAREPEPGLPDMSSATMGSQYPPPGLPVNDTETTFVRIDNPHDMVDPFHSNSDFTTIVLTHAITFFIGVIGNSVVISTWARGGRVRSPTATFLISLACADLLLLIIFMPLETLEYFVITWDQNGRICKLSAFVELLSGMASVLNLVAVSVERFLVIVYPIQARRWCTVSKSRKVLVFIWLLAILFAAPPVFNKVRPSKKRGVFVDIQLTLFFFFFRGGV